MITYTKPKVAEYQGTKQEPFTGLLVSFCFWPNAQVVCPTRMQSFVQLD